MDEDSLNRFVRSLHTAFVDGDLDSFENYMTFPLVLYTSSGVAVVSDPSHLMRLLERYRDAFATNGLVPSAYEIVEREPPMNGRMRAVVQFTNHLEDGTNVTGSLVRYFLLETRGTFKVEMLEFLTSALSLSEVERIVH